MESVYLVLIDVAFGGLFLAVGSVLGKYTKWRDKMDLLLIFVLAAIHYVSDYMSKNPEYTWPEYCEVDHEHIISKKDKGKSQDVSKSSNKFTGRTQRRNMRRTERND